MFLLIFTVNNCYLQDTIKVVSWNTMLLPKLASKSKQTDRAKGIALYLLQNNYDVICLQEVFHKKSLHIIIDSLKNKYSYYDIGNKSSFMRTSSGLITFYKSKIPNSKYWNSRFVKYKKKKYADRIAKKGALISHYKTKDGKIISIINTHLQSKESEKSKRLE